MNRFVVTQENMENFFTDIWLCGPLTLEQFNSAQMVLVQTMFTLSPTNCITGWEENGIYFFAEPHKGETKYWVGINPSKTNSPEFQYLKSIGKLTLL